MLKSILPILLFISITALNVSGQSRPTGLLTDLINDTEAPQALIHGTAPSFSWIVPGTRNGTRQTAYHLIIADSFLKAQNAEGNIWDSRNRQSDSSIAVVARGLVLKPSKQYHWRVKTTTNTGGVSQWSAIKSFRTASQLIDQKPSSEALVKTRQLPQSIKRLSPGLHFFDYGQDAFSQLSVRLTSKTEKDTVFVSFGEAVKDGRLATNPGGTIRYQKIALPLEKGTKTYKIQFKKDQRNTGSAAVLMPDYIGEVYPFRYVEIENYKSNIAKADLQREMVHYPFDDGASHFKSSNDTLNKIWDLSKYSIEATSFAGIYVDGDRERIPYEADALINQLGHYGVDREYSMARRSTDYLLEHPTWPTEWILQALIIAWNDYLYTGDHQLLARNYEVLKNRTLIKLQGNNGLISTTTGLQNKDFAKSIKFDGKIKDIIDWPVSETDGYIFNDYNAVVNAFHYKALLNMKLIAQVLQRNDDVAFYDQESDKLKAAFNTVFFNTQTGLYKDGEKTSHSSLHANMFAMNLGLIPQQNVQPVLNFIKSKGMASSVYGSQFLMEALYDGDEGIYARKLLTDSGIRSWYNMIRVGSTITLEAWDNSFKPNQDWNHAWGAAPANIIPRKLMGIEPTAPGFAEVTIKPQTGDLEHAEILTPTIRGPISLKITNKEPYTLSLKIPANMSGQVYLPILEGKSVISRNGKKIKAERVSGKPYWNAGKIESGSWVFTMTQK
jgi:alpha-L-rhamnosidase